MTVTDCIPAKEKLIVFDTTLRDGEQSPGVTLSPDDKIQIARSLSKLGVDVLEAGFPVASPGDFSAVQRIAREVGPLMEGREKIGKPMIIAGLARAVEKDIQTAYDAVKDAPLKRIHVFLATSDIHLQHKLKITREQCVAQAVRCVKFGRSLCDDIEFSPEDAGRSDPEFLCEVLSAVIEAGAGTLNIPDTVGYNTPAEYGSRLAHLIKHTKGSEKAIWSTHCHDDLGLATANTLAGVANGARQVEVTINGIGERAGNTAMEEVVMNIHTHPATYPVYHTINTVHFARVSQMVADLSGMAVQANKAIVGKNAFLHESGIHQDGVLKNKETYEIIRPEEVGVMTDNLFLGKHSGRNAFRSRLAQLGFDQVESSQLQGAFEAFKRLADQKHKVTDSDLVAIITDSVSSGAGTAQIFYELDSMQVYTNSNPTGPSTATATVILRDLTNDGATIVEAATSATGPIEAAFSAIQRAVKVRCHLELYELKAISGGLDALGKVTVRISEEVETTKDEVNPDPATAPKGGRAIYQGAGTETDILFSSAKAYLNAVNRLLAETRHADLARSSEVDRSVDI
ncbi:2-isopropylmalate synthase (Alpha-isopropylmalate synthase) (Alpha-IPM synthetase) [Tieghemiomyces parasiticus]|uniref:2-isopropylmalate synthase n=1 Tax=Tieghemiomyces parasiticus TaxID=78921 RepID=A0A9W7ZVQ9_9FUNG|nr:2-isopropylmalate synthase (Alpha-isopropylmalate synthase) (Alpha-IPM synthetase) [Tieghemiomyces parasiticus]